MSLNPAQPCATAFAGSAPRVSARPDPSGSGEVPAVAAFLPRRIPGTWVTGCCLPHCAESSTQTRRLLNGKL